MFLINKNIQTFSCKMYDYQTFFIIQSKIVKSSDF